MLTVGNIELLKAYIRENPALSGYDKRLGTNARPSASKAKSSLNGTANHISCANPSRGAAQKGNSLLN